MFLRNNSLSAPRFCCRYCFFIAYFLSLIAIYSILSKYKQDQCNENLGKKAFNSEGLLSVADFYKFQSTRDMNDKIYSHKELVKQSNFFMGESELVGKVQEQFKTETDISNEKASQENIGIKIEVNITRKETQKEQERLRRKQVLRHENTNQEIQGQERFQKQIRVQSNPRFDPEIGVVVLKGRISKERLKQRLSINKISDGHLTQQLSKEQAKAAKIIQVNYSVNLKHQQQQHEQPRHQFQKHLAQVQPNQGNLQHSQHNKNNSGCSDPVTPKLRQQLKDLGLEPVQDHKFRSQYIINPRIYEQSKRTNLTSEKTSFSTAKLISIYNKPTWYGGQKYTDKVGDKKCPYSCNVDVYGTNTSQADVVLIFTGYLKGSRPLPSPRPQGQIWVHIFRESPVHYDYPSNYEDWKSVFNWTLTYRRDSDIFSPYAILSWRHKDLLLTDEDYVAIAKSKTRTATQFASHCGSQSGRDKYVREMQEYIDVDVYGMCGTLQCPKTNDSVCEDKINKTYMFYLSFENSFCEDYVTEKFFRLFRKRLHAIPVVRGGANYSKFFPRGTFVNAADFSSAKELALYLKQLSQNTVAYAQMLKEKDKLTASAYMVDWCNLCEKIHTDKRKHIISDIKAWSHYEGVCKEPPN